MPAQSGQLRIEVVERRLLAVSGATPTIFRRGPAGAIWMLDRKQATFYRFVAGRTTPQEFYLTALFPEFRRGGVHVFPGFAVDARGRALTPAVWTGPGRLFTAAVFVVEPDGSRGRTVLLSPPVEIRHVAAGEGGTLYILGFDTGYSRGAATECHLVHRYSLEGERIASFSSCPGSRRAAESGSLARWLNREAEQGLLWVKDGAVHHLLPSLGRVRVFRPDGTPVRTIRLQSPTGTLAPGRFPPGNGADVTAWARRVVPLGDGGFLVEWLLSQRQGAGRRTLPCLALHDAQGRALSEPRLPPWRRSSLAFSDDEGFCYLVRWLGPDRHELIRARISLD